MHWHEFYEVNIVLKGRGCHYIGEMMIPIASGEVFIIPPNVYHGYLCEDGLDVAHILLKKDFVERYYEELSKLPGFSTLFEIEPYLRQVYDQHLFLQLDAFTVEKLGIEIATVQKHTEDQFNTYQSIYVLHLLSELCFAMYRKNNSASIDGDILKVLEYIQKHYSEKIGVEQLMHLANMSRPTLHRRFKAITQQSPMQYIIGLRTGAARTRILAHMENKTQIAQQYGFYDTSHLNKHLHKK